MIATRQIDNHPRHPANRHVGVAPSHRLRDDHYDLVIAQYPIAQNRIGLLACWDQRSVVVCGQLLQVRCVHVAG